MKLFTKRLRAVAGGAALILSAACGDDPIGPRSLADPQATTAQLAALDDLFDVEVLNSFTALSGDISPAAAPQVGALSAAVRASNPLNRAGALRPYSQSIEQAQVLRQLVPALAEAAIIPPEYLGKTFEWNLTTHQYDLTARTGAPSDGVRYILYAIDPLTGFPADPLVEVGLVDLIDQSTSATSKLLIRVAGVGGTPVYVEYTITVSATLVSGRIAAAGYVTNGAGAPDTLRFAGVVTVSGTQTSATVTQDVSFDVNSRDIYIRNVERVTLTETTITLRVNFRFEHGDEVVTLAALFDVDQVSQTATGRVTVKVNGGLFATCSAEVSASSYTVTCEGADADGLNADEEVALQAIADAVGTVTEIFLGLFGPVITVSAP